jgi:hypothetical protein
MRGVAIHRDIGWIPFECRGYEGENNGRGRTNRVPSMTSF